MPITPKPGLLSMTLVERRREEDREGGEKGDRRLEWGGGEGKEEGIRTVPGEFR